MMDKKKKRLLILAAFGVLLIGAAAMGAAQMQLLPLLGAVAGAAAGMALGWRRDKREAEKREQDAQDC